MKIPEVIRRRKSKKDKHIMAKRNMTKGQAMMHKTLYRNLKIEQHEPH